jgi:hypothetical protein
VANTVVINRLFRTPRALLVVSACVDFFFNFQVMANTVVINRFIVCPRVHSNSLCFNLLVVSACLDFFSAFSGDTSWLLWSERSNHAAFEQVPTLQVEYSPLQQEDQLVVGHVKDNEH